MGFWNKKLWNLYQAERLKYRHTLNGKLWLFMPLLTLLMAYGLSMDYGAANGYNWWYMGLFPAALTLFCCAVGAKDKKLENQTLLLLPLDTCRVWDVKLWTAMRACLLANVTLCVLNVIFGNFVLPVLWMPQVVAISPAQGLLAAAVMTVTSLWQIPFCLWLHQKTGLFPALLLNIFFCVAGGILSVKSWWLLCPWSILPRLMCCIVGILPNGLLAVPGSQTYTPGITDADAVLPGVAVSLLWLAALWLITRLWYQRKGAWIK